MTDIVPNRFINDPETLYAFYCWAIWNLEPHAWIEYYEPSGDDWKEYAGTIFHDGVQTCQGFYQWAAELTDRYQPRAEHLEKFLLVCN